MVVFMLIFILYCLFKTDYWVGKYCFSILLIVRDIKKTLY